MTHEPYSVDTELRRPFRGNWIGPAALPHAQRTPIAIYLASVKGKSRRVTVHATACPAVFFHIEVGPTTAEHDPVAPNGYTLSTGASGTKDIPSTVAMMADLISRGMLGLSELVGLNKRGK